MHKSVKLCVSRPEIWPTGSEQEQYRGSKMCSEKPSEESRARAKRAPRHIWACPRLRVVEGFQDEKTTLHNRIVASQPEFVRVNRVTGRRKTEATILALIAARVELRRR